MGRGDAYIGSGETEENLAAAKSDYEAAIGLDETCVDAYLGLANVYIGREDYSKAREVLLNGLDAIESIELQNKLLELENWQIDDEASGQSEWVEERFEVESGGYEIYRHNIETGEYDDTMYNADGSIQWYQMYDESDHLVLSKDYIDGKSDSQIAYAYNDCNINITVTIERDGVVFAGEYTMTDADHDVLCIGYIYGSNLTPSIRIGEIEGTYGSILSKAEVPARLLQN